MDVIEQLDLEWRTLLRSRAMRKALRRWGDEDPALRFDSLDALVAHVERRDVHPSVNDRVLAALARRAPDDTRAARVLLQLLLPGCKALVRRYQIGTREERAALVAGAAWDRIRTYPIDRRPAKIAANVLADVRNRVLRAYPVQPPPASLDALPERLAPSVLPGREPEQEVAEILGWAVRSGLLDRASARLIVLTRVAGVSVSELAEAEGASEQTLRQRRLRAEAKLREAVVTA